MAKVGDIVDYDHSGEVVKALVKFVHSNGDADLEVLETGRRVNSVTQGGSVNQFTHKED